MARTSSTGTGASAGRVGMKVTTAALGLSLLIGGLLGHLPPPGAATRAAEPTTLAPAAPAPPDRFDPTVCQYPVRLEPICPDVAPPAPAAQP